jgi:hypothetical protein
MVFTVEQSSVDRAERDVQQVYEIISRLLQTALLISTTANAMEGATPDLVEIEHEPQPDQITVELENESPQPALQLGDAVIDTTPEPFSRLPGAPELQALPPSPDSGFELTPDAPLLSPGLEPDLTQTPVRLQLDDAVIESSLAELPDQLRQWQPEQIATVREALETPAILEGAEIVQPSAIGGSTLDLEVAGALRLQQVDGAIVRNDFAAEAVEMSPQTGAPREAASLTLPQSPEITLSQPEASTVELNSGSLSEGVGGLEQTQFDDRAPSGKPEADTASAAALEQPVSDLLPFRPPAEVEVITGQQLGNTPEIHASLIREAPSVQTASETGRTANLNAPIQAVEFTEDRLEADLTQDQTLVRSAESLKQFFEQTGAKQIELGQGGQTMIAQYDPDRSQLTVFAPDGNRLSLGADGLNSDLNQTNVQQLAGMASMANQYLQTNAVAATPVASMPEMDLEP